MEEDDDFTGAIEKLMFQGIINSGDVKKLQNAGIYSCNGLMMHTKKNLTGIYGLSNTKVDQIWEAVEKIVARASPLFPLNIKAYELKSKIGFGPRATVYKAYCIPTKSMVAIKIFNRGADSDVRREATTLSDPNLLTYSSFKVDWVVMPFMACGSLQSIVYSSFPLGLPERYACFFLSKILKGMVHLHDQEIDHGGIKGGNMLVDSDGEVKICVSTPSTQACDDIRDFGLLAAELVYGVGGGKSYLHAEKKVSEELQDLMSLCRRSTRRVSADDLLRHACFKELVENETVSNFLADLPSLEVMANQAQKALNNHLKTVNTIGRKDLMDKLLGKRKRMEVLRSSIALDSRQKGQIDHWKMELESCERKVKNLEKQILERRPIEQ